jgi:hypothetical protein
LKLFKTGRVSLLQNTKLVIRLRLKQTFKAKNGRFVAKNAHFKANNAHFKAINPYLRAKNARF